MTDVGLVNFNQALGLKVWYTLHIRTDMMTVVSACVYKVSWILLLLVVVVIELLYTPEIKLNTSVYIILFIPRNPQIHVQMKALSMD